MAPNLRPRKPLLITEEEAEALRETLRQRFGTDFDIESEDDPDFEADEEVDDDDDDDLYEEKRSADSSRSPMASGNEDEASSTDLPASSGASTTPSNSSAAPARAKNENVLPLTSVSDLQS